MMKRLLIFLTLSAMFALEAEVFTPAWQSGIKIVPDGRQTGVFLRNDANFAMVGTEPKTDVSLVDFTFDAAGMRVDTTRFFAQYPKGVVVMRLNRLPFEQSMRLKTMKLELNIGGTPDGLKGVLYFEGNQGEDKKHYWKAKEFQLGDTVKNISFEQTLPGDLNALSLRCDLRSAGVYTIESAAFGEVAIVTADVPSGNLLVNGGAELGFYNTGVTGFSSWVMADDNQIYDGYGKRFAEAMTATLDSETKHSGLFSFRLDGSAQKPGRLSFAPVPFIAGKPAVFAVWLKAEKPGTPVDLNLFLASGIAYGQRVTVGTEWQRCQLLIPSWGGDAPGVTRVNDVVNGYGAVFNKVMPLVTPAGGVVYVDDAVYLLSKEAAGFQNPAISILGKLDNPKGYSVAGQPLAATLQLQALQNQSETDVSWELIDFFGKVVAQAPAEKIKLSPGQSVTKNFTVQIPGGVRGALVWRFAVGGQKYAFYTGAVDAPGAMLPRIGINYDSRQNAQTAIAILRDFRFGSVRMWAEFRRLPYHGFRDVPYFKNAGFYVMMCVGLRGAAPEFQAPLDFTLWQQQLAEYAGKVKGQVDAYEILNESNIWGGRTPVTDPAKFQEMTVPANAATIHAAAQTIRTVDPAAKISGPASCHTDINWTAGVLKAGAANDLDMVTEHPYRELPELPDYEEDLINLRQVMAAYKSEFPLIASEAGERSTALFAGNEIPDYERKRCNYNLRMMLIGFANNLAQYHHFALDQTADGTGWDMTLFGDADHRWQRYPAPVMYAVRNAADRLENAVPAGRVKLGSDYRCYIFDRGDKRVAAVWKWSGAPTSFQLGDPSAVTVYDLMGSKIAADALTVSESPIYLESSLSADKLAALLSNVALGDNGKKVTGELIIRGSRQFGIKFTNLTGTPVSGKVKLFPPGIAEKSEAEFAAIPAESSAVVAFAAVNAIQPQHRPFEAEITVDRQPPCRMKFDLRSILVPHAAKAIAIDGDLADWPQNAKIAALGKADQIKIKPWTAADEAINADLYLAWDENYLYLAAVVNKADNVQNRMSASALWSADGLQLGFDPLRNAAADLAGYQNDDFEFSVGRFKDQPEVFMHQASAATYDSLDKPLGLVPNVKRSIKVEPGRTVYELAFPRMLVSPFRLQPDSAMRFNVIVNVNNGNERIGWLELAPGIGQSPKRPGQFMDLVLLK